MDTFWLPIQAGISVMYLLYFWGINQLQQPKTNSQKPPVPFMPFVSVLIAAKNEAKQLEQNLSYFLNQSYHKNELPNFEVIVINDHSSDHSLDVLQRFKDKHPQLSIIDYKANTTSSKKKALTKGVENAKGKYLVFSDADCQPISKRWLHLMVTSLRKKDIVLGYGGFYPENSWINKVHAYETYITALQYLSFALHLSPYMGVGRNMAYKKHIFLANNGFVKHEQLASGDDDLFVQEAATQKNTAICIAQEAMTISEAPTTWKSWWKQKKRHLSTAYKYKLNHQLLLGSIALLRFSFWTISLFLLICFSNLYVWMIFIATWIAIHFINHRNLIHFNQKRLGFLLLFLDLKLVLFHLILVFSNTKTKATSWK